jgi:hypothetical protein
MILVQPKLSVLQGPKGVVLRLQRSQVVGIGFVGAGEIVTLVQDLKIICPDLGHK